MFFSFDGIDGAGKSTQLRLFCDWLRQQGLDVQQCRDPGGTELGEAVRGILLGSSAAIGRRAEMFLYMSSRAQLVEQVIEPALAEGKTVVCDRYQLANVVYQGHAGGLDVATLWDIGRFATCGVAPDMTFLLDLPLETAAARLGRPLDRMEQQGEEYRRRLRDDFLQEAARQPQRIVVIDAARSVDEVQADIRSAAAKWLGMKDEG